MKVNKFINSNSVQPVSLVSNQISNKPQLSSNGLASARAYSLEITPKEVWPVRKIAIQIEKNVWGAPWVRSSLEVALGKDSPKIEPLMSFLSNFYNVYEQRYREERQLKYMETSKNMLTYVAEEPLQKYLDGGKAFFSYVSTLSQPASDKEAGGIINGAVIDVNAVRADIAIKQAYENTLSSSPNIFVNFIGYICPSNLSGKGQKELASRLLDESGKLANAAGLSLDFTIKEFVDHNDFETKFMPMKSMLVVPGLRIVEAIFDYYPDGAPKPIDLPEKLAQDGSLYLAIQRMKEAPAGELKNYLTLEQVKAIVEAEYGYRMLQDVRTTDGREALKVFVDYALQNVKVENIGGTDYVKLETLKKCVERDEKTK